jgi:hypothetical protein
VAGGAVTFIEERKYLPTGADPGDREAWTWCVEVTYMGNGKWSAGRGRHEVLTHTGKWLYCPHRMTEVRWARHDFATACRLAEEAVETRTINGWTWAQFQAWRAERAAAG